HGEPGEEPPELRALLELHPRRAPPPGQTFIVAHFDRGRQNGWGEIGQDRLHRCPAPVAPILRDGALARVDLGLGARFPVRPSYVTSAARRRRPASAAAVSCPGKARPRPALNAGA